jgi:hypothetical protein
MTNPRTGINPQINRHQIAFIQSRKGGAFASTPSRRYTQPLESGMICSVETANQGGVL